MARWTREVRKLPRGHAWKARPGYKIFVADRGAVRFDYPGDWIVRPGDDADIEVRDREPPDDDCLLQLTLLRLHPGIDWRGPPLPELLAEATRGDRRVVTSRGEIISVQRDDLELAWQENRFIDVTQGNREAVSRACLARRGTILPLITMDFWLDHLDRFGPVWDEVLRTLQLGVYVADPTRHYLH